ncbi:hypothetical protein K402DRAFT_65624 [Aulographum hederae CBS 113979]|uniref:Uncharacterized protein n=1 Tax=Aulographum hederae CBS 113979 TaxID=1176131 RepID=A0A6G1H0K9_9PEZI|nr:hypothetical protein K402DRAFT_65624 [Aulographum hederae CBS 113979]
MGSTAAPQPLLCHHPDHFAFSDASIARPLLHRCGRRRTEPVSEYTLRSPLLALHRLRLCPSDSPTLSGPPQPAWASSQSSSSAALSWASWQSGGHLGLRRPLSVIQAIAGRSPTVLKYGFANGQWDLERELSLQEVQVCSLGFLRRAALMPPGDHRARVYKYAGCRTSVLKGHTDVSVL